MTNSRKCLKVLHVVSSLEIGGAERFVLDLCQVQQSKGFVASIMSFGKSRDPLHQACNQLDISVYNIQGNRISKWLQVYKVVKNFDVIHFHSPYPLKFISIILPILNGKRIVYTRHGAAPLSDKAWKTMHRFVQKYVDAITFVSQEGANVFEKNHGWPEKIKHVIDNGVNLSSVQVTRTSSSLLRLGSVGRMVDLKNQISLLQAIARLSPEGQQLLEVNFYGDGPCLQKLKLYAEDNLDNVNVYFHGMVQDRNVIYSSIDALVVTSETEGLSLAIIEAMAYGCAVIASNVGGNPKLIEHDVNGWLFEYDDNKTLSEYIHTLQTQQALLSTFGKAGRQKIEQQFSLDSCADKYSEIYFVNDADSR
jgi:glycosyltransferase involved in cell wall biosynthesis